LNLTEREADLAVRTARPKEPSLVLRRISGFASAVYASKSFGKVVPTELSRYPFVGVDDASWVESLWLARQVPGARVFKSNSTEAQLAVTARGVGLGILPCYVGDAEPDLVRVVEPDKGLTRELWLVMHKDLQTSARIRRVADFLARVLVARAAEFEGRSKTAGLGGRGRR
jgi:DNA-binding transcriptional LysR family regulator